MRPSVSKLAAAASGFLKLLLTLVILAADIFIAHLSKQVTRVNPCTLLLLAAWSYQPL